MDLALHTMSSSVINKYDVFISFRGEDTRKSFTSHLYKALCNKQINVYIDEKTLGKGEEISSALLKAIQKSKISLIIFSENYATSTWCLEELVHILKCREENGQIVIPIFYGVDPSHVRKQEGSFARAFVTHQQCSEDRTEKLHQWRAALESAGRLSGWDTRDRYESKLIEEIVEDVASRLRSRTTADFGGLVGIGRPRGLVGLDRRLKKFEPLFCIGPPNVRILSIWGSGGIGKTTLAEVIFRIFSSRFENCLFVENIREVSERFGLAYLEYRLFSELLKEESIDMANHSIQDRIRRKKVLLVLDDVDDTQQLKRLAGDHTWFGPGSRVIITTRNRHLLHYCCADVIYEVGLSFDKALELFRFCASKGRPFISGYPQLSQSVVHYAHRRPSSFRMLYCRLRIIKEGESMLNRQQEVPVMEINLASKVSCDELDDMEKDIFLDIACFLKGRDTDFVERILEKFGSVARIGIAVLVDKSLISIKGDGEIDKHGLLREMAWEIVRQSRDERNYSSAINKGIETEGRYLEMSNIDYKELSLRRTVLRKRYESKLAEVIVEQVTSKLSYASSRTTTSFKGLVGINSELQKFESLLRAGSPDVRVLGIWGMGVIGKTTLARVVFSRLSSEFEGCFFLNNIRDESAKHGLAYLEHKLFSKLLKEKDVVPFVKYKIQPKKVLIVLDDVDHSYQIERLAGYHTWFGSGSRLIITTRGRDLLRHFVDEIYEVDGLNFDEALELFCLNAFRGRPFISGYAQLSLSIVHYAHGIPLALKVLGSFLCDQSIREWESELNKLRCIPSNDIYKVLRVSYDELEYTEREIFLDIARFFEGRNRDFVERKLEEFDFVAEVGIEVLIDKSLISIKGDGEIYIHSLIRGMAWEIDRLSNRKHERNYGSSFNKGIGAEGRHFDMSNIDYEELLSRTILGKRYHSCYDYPQKSLPSKISPHNLVELDMPSIKLKQYWNEVQDTSSSASVRIYISYEGQWR